MAITKDALKTLSVEEVLNINLEEVPDAGFKIWPDGTYHVVFAEPKVEDVGKDKLPRLTIPYVLVEVMELADPESEAVAAESENQLGYMLPGGASMIHRAAVRREMGYLRGTPDLVAMKPSCTVWLECKILGNDCSQEQSEFSAWAIRTGHGYCVITSIEDAGAVLTIWGMING